jgi:hypothetical protein
MLGFAHKLKNNTCWQLKLPSLVPLIKVFELCLENKTERVNNIQIFPYSEKL